MNSQSLANVRRAIDRSRRDCEPVYVHHSGAGRVVATGGQYTVLIDNEDCGGFELTKRGLHFAIGTVHAYLD